MPAEVTCLGYTCPQCRERVVVLCSAQHPPMEFVTGGEIESKCKCGWGRSVLLSDIHTLDLWIEYAMAA